MSSFRLVLPFFLVFGLLACNTSPSLQSQLVNHWEMASIMQNGQDVSEQHNPKNNRWIDLQSDGTFISDGDPYGRNTGRWTINEQNMELFLDSDAGEGDDSYWIAEIKEDQVFLKGTRSDFTEQFGMVWRKGE